MAEPSGGTTDKKSRFPTGFSTLRDLITFIVGMIVIVNEVFFAKAVEPYALGVGIALCGLPLALQADERRGSGGSGG